MAMRSLSVLLAALPLLLKTVDGLAWQTNKFAQWRERTFICPEAASEAQMGYMNVGDTSSNNTGSDLWFWLFRERDKSRAAKVHKPPPLVLILGGDAGIPATQQVFGGTGPLRLNFGKEGAADMNKWSFNSKADMLYLDYPAPIGLSILRSENQPVDNKTILTRETPTSEEDLWMFMQRFLRTFPEYKGRRFGIWGYDLSSQQAINFGRYILEQNERIEEGELDDEPVNLETLGLVSPMIDPVVQLQQGLVFAKSNRHTRMIGDAKYNLLQDALDTITPNVKRCIEGTKRYCFNEQDMWLAIWKHIVGLGTRTPRQLFDPWNARGKLPAGQSVTDNIGHNPNWAVGEYLRLSRTLNLIMVPHKREGAEKRYECRSDTVLNKIRDKSKWMASSVKNLEFLLDQGVRTWIVGGEADLMCSYLSLQEITNRLKWRGQEAYNNQTLEPFSFLDIDKPEEQSPPTIGEYRQHDNLAWFNIYNRGHDLDNEVPDIMQTIFKMLQSGKALFAPKRDK